MKHYALTSALGAFIVLTTANVALAQGPTSFPMVGVTGAQTLQLNLVAYPPTPCGQAGAPVTLGFQNRAGVAVGRSEAVILTPGQSMSLAYNLSSVNGADERVELLPTVTGWDGALTGAGCVASVEVIENATGVTTVLAPGAVAYPPNPSFGMLGVTLVETVRLNVVAYPPTPCIGTIGFVDKNGNPVKIGNQIVTMQVDLSPGQATHLDLPGGGALGQRAEVRPVVAVAPPAEMEPPNACIASAEVYTKDTGVTRAVYYPPTPCSQSSGACVAF